ncbi:MAG: DNA phosphorothioation-associated putative methyltransferase [Gammaproteobacteria bacterium]|nr:DNA phosphorothioation-associated putative methyltransferase [Gammaproteobacteria bacterium]
MDADKFKQLVKSITVGKKLPDAIYFHRDAFEHAPEGLTKFIVAVAKALKIKDEDWNLVKVFRADFKLSLLHYPDFFSDSYPAIEQSVTVDLSKLSHRITQYRTSDNPPILHRKETMLPPSHKCFDEFRMITQEGEAAGLYENSRMIGFKNSWLRLIAKHGYELVDGRLFRNSAVCAEVNEDKEIDRHKTAIVRHELSAPMKSVAKNGFLSGEYSVFDYGCGRGDDLRELEAHGIEVLGWDPNFRPDADKVNSDIVNIGFVINVIEDQDERIDAILNAWELSDKLLVISAMLANESYLAQFTPYKDGVITSRNTFQKYYSQTELKSYIERVLDQEPIAISPGIFYVFKDKNLEQQFLKNRHKRSYQWQQLTVPKPVSEDQARILFTQHHELLESFWLSCLAYGRCPANDEFRESEKIKEIIGSNKKALKLVTDWFGDEELKLAQIMRQEDLLIYFALAMFEKRKAYTHQPDDLKRDIKAFFDTYKIAQHQAKELLFNIANVEQITAECIQAKETLPAAKLAFEHDIPHSLTLHKKFIDLLSPLLRVYVFSAMQLYGQLDDIQLIKIHITSGKVTLLGYEGFDTTPLPQLKERVKINMITQDVYFFDYVDEHRRPVLLDKDEFIDTSFEGIKNNNVN